MIWDQYGIEVQHAQIREAQSPLFIGMECEIESVRDHGKAGDYGFNVTTDGSLRNDGFEYITRAITVPEAIVNFQKLHATLRFGVAPKFSPRTSIHVHANCANLSEDAVRNIVLLYALYEEAFFLMCEADRRDNIHCTPLTETFLPNVYSAGLSTMIAKWHKYTALNLKPLTKQGTIEFRHMQGHNDSMLLAEWLTIIKNLFEVSNRYRVDQNLFGESRMESVYNQIFGQSRIGGMYKMVRSMMSNQILDLKLAVI